MTNDLSHMLIIPGLALAVAACATHSPSPAPPVRLITAEQIKDLCPVSATPVCTRKINSIPKCSCQGKEELQRLLEPY